jgi:hypothetical protein
MLRQGAIFIEFRGPKALDDRHESPPGLSFRARSLFLWRTVLSEAKELRVNSARNLLLLHGKSRFLVGRRGDLLGMTGAC